MKKILALAFIIFLATTAEGFCNYTPVYGGQLINDSTNALGSGAASTIMSANANRKYLFLENLSSVSICCNPFGAAVCGTAPTFTITQYGSWAMGGNYVYTGALSCIAASSSNISLVAYEGQ